MAVYALYATGEDAQRAVNGLRRTGVADPDITVISWTPMEDFEFSHINKNTPFWYTACAGGLAGMLLSTWLVTYASNDWPMNVGNMPTNAWWTFLIIIFEMTMLGAIFTTVVMILTTSGLLRRRPKMYDEAVSYGQILVGVENPTSVSDQDIERALRIAPGVQTKTV
jgi:hypothetical protein